VICPKCGEDNSSNFRFCGMCGTALEARRPVGAPKATGAAEPIRTASSGIVEPRAPVATRAAVDAEDRVPPSAGPSLLGLNQPSSDAPNGNDQAAFRDQFFSGTESFYEPEDPNIGARRVVLLLLLLAILGAGGWWAYSNYNKSGGMKRNIPILNTTPAGNESATNNPPPSAKPEKAAPADSASSQPAEPPANPSAQSANTNPAPAAESKAEQPKAEQSAAASVPAKDTEPERPSRSAKSARAERAKASSSRATSRPSPEVTSDKGDAEFRRGEAYLYGRGMRANCDEAVRNLKEASAKQNAKARSTFGTMYATGHCVPRDLPTSYSWFALALRADPNNQVLEKDLVAIWNQMTPPERQMATRAKQ
jgi:hypothetical protein